MAGKTKEDVVYEFKVVVTDEDIRNLLKNNHYKRTPENISEVLKTDVCERVEESMQEIFGEELDFFFNDTVNTDNLQKEE